MLSKLKILLLPFRHRVGRSRRANPGARPTAPRGALRGKPTPEPAVRPGLSSPAAPLLSRAQSWSRALSGSGGFAEPRHDTNAPDLYLPTMAFVTYVLLIAYHLGQQGRFTPEIFSMAASRGLGVVLLEVVFMKAAFYFFPASALPSGSGGSGAALLDLVAYSGYKFVGVVLSSLVGLFAPAAVSHLVTIYVALCTGARDGARRGAAGQGAARRRGRPRALTAGAPRPSGPLRRLLHPQDAHRGARLGDAHARGDEAELLHLRAGGRAVCVRVVPRRDLRGRAS